MTPEAAKLFNDYLASGGQPPASEPPPDTLLGLPIVKSDTLTVGEPPVMGDWNDMSDATRETKNK